MTFLIRELTEDVQCIVEAKGDNGKKDLFIEGIFLMGDSENRNRRIYPVGLLEREVSRYSNEFIGRNRAFGELDHPQGSSINLDRVSHMITNLRREGNNFVGKAKIIETPMGAIAKALIESGAQLAVSSRGMGSMKRNARGIMEVQEDFYLATAADIVADPSAPQAFVNGLAEGYDWVFDLAENKLVSQEFIEASQVEVKETVVETAKREFDPAKALAMFESFVREVTKSSK